MLDGMGRSRGESRRKRRGKSIVGGIAIAGIIIFVLVFMFLNRNRIYVFACALFGIHIQENAYVYHHLSVAKQNLLTDLMISPQEASFEKDVKEQEDLYLEMLHLTQNDKVYSVSDVALEMARKRMEEDRVKFQGANQDIYIQSEVDGIQGATNYYNAYSENKNPENLYQAANALFGKLNERDVKDIKVASAIIINWLGHYLSETGEGHSEASIYFVIAKTYYILAQDAEDLEDFKDFIWMLAYANMEKAYELIDEEHACYGLYSYYMGSIGFQLLKRIQDEGDDFASEMQATTSKYLVDAQSCLGKPNYRREQSMQENIANMLLDDYLH